MPSGDLVGGEGEACADGGSQRRGHCARDGERGHGDVLCVLLHGWNCEMLSTSSIENKSRKERISHGRGENKSRKKRSSDLFKNLAQSLSG